MFSRHSDRALGIINTDLQTKGVKGLVFSLIDPPYFLLMFFVYNVFSLYFTNTVAYNYKRTKYPLGNASQLYNN